MAYYLRKERDEDVVGAYRRYQQYLQENRNIFPRNALMLGTAEWYQNPSDHRCPHDGWLESLQINEKEVEPKNRSVALRIRLLGAYHDGYIEFSYPQVFEYSFEGSRVSSGLGDWLCDEFRLSPDNRLIHEIEWGGTPRTQGSNWIIEASDVEFRWVPFSDAPPQ